MIPKVLLAVLMLACPAFAQLRPVTPGEAKAATIVTNGELTAERQFHMLIIHDRNAAAEQLARMCRQPQSKEMQSWSQAIEIRPMHVTEPFVAEHHSDLIQKWQGQLPIVALVDRSGGVWWSAGATQIPGDEKRLSTVLNTAYSQTLEAARKSPSGPIQPPPVQNGPVKNTQVANGGSYFLERGRGAPDGYSTPNLSPSPINLSLVPNQIETSVNLGALPLICVIGAFAVFCTLLAAASPVISAMIIGAAITDDDDQEKV